MFDMDKLSDAEHLIVKDIQTTSFAHEVKLVSSCQPLPLSNKLSALCPFLDKEGILRVGGRLTNLNIPRSMKHPPILDRTHAATKLLISWKHRRNGHVGTDQVLALLREEYWILGGRIAVNQVVQRCFLC